MDNITGDFQYIGRIFYAYVYVYFIIFLARYIIHSQNIVNYNQLKFALQL